MSSKKHQYFGTDGIRGTVGKGFLTADWIVKLGNAIGKYLTQYELPKKVLIARDPRISGELFELALKTGLHAAGIDTIIVGVIPTPAVAYLTPIYRAGMGLVISASHNPYHDNGIKFFTDKGHKLNFEQESEIESLLQTTPLNVKSNKIGCTHVITDAEGRYIEFCKRSFPQKQNLNNIKIVLDCANGATFKVAPLVLSELGAEIITLHNTPNGFNINEKSGALYPEQLATHVLKEKADCGIALDGDGDRLIMVDHKGQIIDGDEILYILTKGYLAQQALSGGVVGTVMSNMGLEKALKAIGVEFIRTQVGDKYVMAELQEKNWLLGGETSGHIICLDLSQTGDGIVAALKVLSIMQALGLSLYEVKQGIEKYPQILINLPLDNTIDYLNLPEIKSAIKEAELKLNSEGRILLRQSGTEPCLRVMVEAKSQTLAKKIANQLATLITSIRQEV